MDGWLWLSRLRGLEVGSAQWGSRGKAHFDLILGWRRRRRAMGWIGTAGLREIACRGGEGRGGGGIMCRAVRILSTRLFFFFLAFAQNACLYLPVLSTGRAPGVETPFPS